MRRIGDPPRSIDMVGRRGQGQNFGDSSPGGRESPEGPSEESSQERNSNDPYGRTKSSGF